MPQNNLPRTYFFTKEDLPLLQFTHTFAAGSVWLEKKMDQKVATFDLFVRDMPANRNYMMFGGLEEILVWLKEFNFSKEDVSYLLKRKVITKKFAKYLENFQFHGTVYAMPEGTIFFPGEPIIRVTAPIIEASLIELFLMSTTVSNTIFLTKAARLRVASQDKFNISCGPFRAHSFESGIKASRAAYLCGLSATQVNLCVARKYHIERQGMIIGGQHLFVKSFPDEISSFRALAEYYPNRCSLFVDTYDFKKGLANAITVVKELRQKGQTISQITIDSGDIFKLAKYARRKLDQVGLSTVGILLAGNIDEYKIKKLVDKKIPCTCAVSVTEYGTVFDSPKLEIVYKLAEMREGEEIINTAKLSPGKLSYPSRKQVFRIFKDEKIYRDYIGLETEKIGKPLLVKVMDNGKVVYKLPSFERIRKYINVNLNELTKPLLNIIKPAKYQVLISKKLNHLLEEVKKKHL